MARQDSLQGSLPLMVLKILGRRGPLHGYGITAQIESMSKDILRVEEGSLYPALHRLEQDGLLRAAWKPSETGRTAKFYRLTGAGKKRLETEERSWQNVRRGIAKVLRYAPEAE